MEILQHLIFFEIENFMTKLTIKAIDGWPNGFINQLSSHLFLDILTEGVSDNFYFENLNEDILGTRQKNYLTRRINVKWVSESIKLEGEIRKYKDLNPFASEQYETSPNISLSFQESYGD